MIQISVLNVAAGWSSVAEEMAGLSDAVDILDVDILGR